MLARSFRRNAAALVGRASAILLAVLTTGAAMIGSSACSLGNVEHDDCTSNDECVLAIGPNSQCTDGYCTDPPTCSTGHDCRRIAGGGACVGGFCVSQFPVDPQCQGFEEPADLPSTRLAGPEAPLVIGGIFSLDSQKDQVLTQAIRLAVKEINDNGEMNRGQQLSIVFCDNGGPGNKAQGAERDALNNHAIDYLAGTLGVPYIVGPLSSADSLKLIARLTEKNYPTAVISPSATSPALTSAKDSLADGQPGLFWRTCPSDVLQGAVMAQNLIGTDAAVTKVAVVYGSDSYGSGLAEVFQTNLDPMKQSQLFPIPIDKIADPATLAQVGSEVDAYAPNGVLVITVQAGQTVDVLRGMVGKNVATAAKFFFTDGAKDEAVLLSSSLEQGIKDIVASSKGTAPASPSGTTYNFFLQNMKATWSVDAAGFSFTAQAYDATYVGAYGTIWASRDNNNYDGVTVAEGMGKLAAGADIDITANDWNAGKTALSSGQTINVYGTSGPLDFDATTGEAKGRIEIWRVEASKFFSETTIEP